MGVRKRCQIASRTVIVCHFALASIWGPRKHPRNNTTDKLFGDFHQNYGDYSGVNYVIVALRRAQEPCVQICAIRHGTDGLFARAAGLLYTVQQYTTRLLSLHGTVYSVDVSQTSGICLPNIQSSVQQSGGSGEQPVWAVTNRTDLHPRLLHPPRINNYFG